jgi:hypothetical protein
MATKEKMENIPSIGNDEIDDLNINFIKEHENENDELNSFSSNHKIKDENVKLFGDSDISKNSKEENEQKEKEKEKENSKLTQKESKEKKSDSINLFKKSIPSSKNDSSSKVNKRYSNQNQNENKNDDKNKKEEDKDKNENGKEFVNSGKFMQINPHFNIFNKQIDSLRDSIYDDTKRCLILKGSLQESSNFLKKESNSLIKDIVEQIYNLRELFEKGNKGLNQTTNEVKDGLKKLKEVQSKARKEIIECDKRIGECENQIGYKLLGNPSYCFMKDKKIKTVK